MRRVLIIYPHWPPSNLAGVHRARLTANALVDLGQNIQVLSVDPHYYEETPDDDLIKTVRKGLNIYLVEAFPVTKIRIIGDIGLRALTTLYREAKQIVRKEKIDFIWIPIPSFYTALLGRFLYNKTGVAYGIDYIDPWVRDISTRRNWRHLLSNRLAKYLEPIAVKKAALISGVSYEYYRPVLERNFEFTSGEVVNNGLRSGERVNSEELTIKGERWVNPNLKGYQFEECAFPYGFDPGDHEIKMDDIQYPWSKNKDVIPWIYAGAFLPKSRLLVDCLFSAIAELKERGFWPDEIGLYFIGTGQYMGKSIADYAKDHGLEDTVYEHRARYPYLQVLNFLSIANTVMVIGSTEKHYTASKVFQALLSERPVWSVFHVSSSAAKVLEECKADQFMVRFREGMSEGELKRVMRESLLERLGNKEWNPDLKELDKYSAKEGAKKLVEAIERILESKKVVR